MIRGVGFTPVELLFDGWQEQIAVFDAGLAAALEQSLCAGQPTAGLSDVSAQREPKPEPEQATRGTQRLARAQIEKVSTLERLQVVAIAANQIRRVGEQLEIGRA
jgi:hypothetical protein